ncbi:MAG: bifunctional riboflavin kinase/FAD synthetase [Crocinitomicaceae bacterium]
MKIFRDFITAGEIKNPVLTIGTFDGVHVGHQKIIERLNEEAEKIGGESVLFTFYPHPRMVLYPESHGLKLIQTQVEKVDKLRRIGLDNLIVYPFTKEFSRLTAVEFVRDYLVNELHVKKLVIGYDHHFGKNREGNIDFLREVAETYGFEVIEISAQDIDEVNVSSTKIRNAITEGEMRKAEQYLGEPFELHGRIVHGKSMGKQIGYPTANIDIETDIKLIPSTGVYAVNVFVSDYGIYEGMLNVGYNPTIGGVNDVSIEVHLFDFDRDIYGEFVTVQFLSRIRDEQKFESVHELRDQLREDEIHIRSFFAGSN